MKHNMTTGFFVKNRLSLLNQIHGGVAVFTANTLMQRNNDTAFFFEQEANFWWLTGIEEPDWQLILDATTGKSWLVTPDIDSIHQTFEGILGNANASKISGVQTIIGTDEAMTLLRTLAKKHTIVHTVGSHPHKAHFNFSENPAGSQLHKTLERIFHSVKDCRAQLSSLRAIKQPEEIKAMSSAINLTIDAFESAKERLQSLQYEYEVEAAFDFSFRRKGASHAYDPIVASGQNACTLHYVKNNARILERHLVLLDIGARMHGYAADISRTYAYGEPTKRQQQIHAAVVSAHQQIVSILTPGLSVENYSNSVDSIMKDALVSVDLIKNTDDERYRTYFPHAISHGLGVDVHDSLGSPRVFEPGMVLTVEPGIYIPEEGIGVRIEDDILITEKGHKNLSTKLSTDW